MATYSYDDFVKAANNAGLYNQFSQADLSTAQKNPEFGQSMLSLKQSYASAATDEQRRQINDQANQLRSSYGNYTGGTDGSKYISTGLLNQKIDDQLDKVGSYAPFSYDAAKPEYSSQNDGKINSVMDQIGSYAPFSFDTAKPSYENQYATQQAALLNDILNRKEFEWSKETDPQWAPLKKEYLREGDRATANALAQASAASGGRASSYAVNAASQAGDYYATQLTDKLPELYQQAYDRYLNEQQLKYSDLNAVNNQEQLDYSKYLNDLGQWNTDRSFAYNDYQTQYNMLQSYLANLQSAEQMGFNKYLSDLEQYNTDRNFAYNDYQTQYNMLQTQLANLQGQQQTEFDQAWDMEARTYEREQAQKAALQAQVDAILSAGGTPGSDLVGGSGYADEYVQAIAAEYQRQAAEKQQAALRELADWYAGYGDYSKAAEMGVNTGYMQAAQLASGGSRSSGGSDGGNNGETGYDALFKAALASGYPQSYIANNYKNYGFTNSSGLYNDYQTWYEGQSGGLQVDLASILALGYGPISETRLDELVQSGEVQEYEENGLLKFRKVAQPKGTLGTLKASELFGLR